jgi:hypothetical protein
VEEVLLFASFSRKKRSYHPEENNGNDTGYCS